MEIIAALLALWIGPAYLTWSLVSSSRLNRSGAAVARRGEALAWSGFLSSICGVGLWLASGRQALTWGWTAESTLLGVRLDALSAPLLLLVSFLAAIILRYTRNYLGGDPRQGHFVKWICITLGSVITLIVSPGLIQFTLAWVATSLSLHQLLVFFPDRHGTQFSARKKFLISRVADLSVILAFIGLYNLFGTQDFDSLLAQISLGQHSLGWIAWLIALAAILKSAQFPFHTWLPDTMGTPTPVSALMHAGIINGGGFLLIRFHPLFTSANAPLYAVAIVGAITAVFASLVMLSQTSIKRSLAYSTIAQMGFMLLQCGLGAYSLALLHIVAHALYKAHSFLSSGSTVQVIESHSTESQARTHSHRPLFAALVLSFSIVVGLAFVSGATNDPMPGKLALGVVVAMAITHLLLRQLRHSIRVLSVAKSVGLAIGVAVAYLSLAEAASWWMQPLLGNIPRTNPIFESTLAIALAIALATTLQLQVGSLFLIPRRFREALYVHALNGFYANALANRLLRLVKLQPKQA